MSARILRNSASHQSAPKTKAPTPATSPTSAALRPQNPPHSPSIPKPISPPPAPLPSCSPHSLSSPVGPRADAVRAAEVAQRADAVGAAEVGPQRSTHHLCPTEMRSKISMLNRPHSTCDPPPPRTSECTHRRQRVQFPVYVLVRLVIHHRRPMADFPDDARVIHHAY